jgi:hypothetical protein
VRPWRLLVVVPDRLVLANVGDCGVLVLRNSHNTKGSLLQHDSVGEGGWYVYFRSHQQLHDFNYPFQVSTARCVHSSLWYACCGDCVRLWHRRV